MQLEDRPSGNKRSLQQSVVKMAILNRFDHPTAEEVCRTARKTCPKISLATVYRNLDRLVDDGLIEKFVVPGEPDRYDPLKGEHYHVYCQKCGMIYDIDVKIASKIAKVVKKQTGLEMTSLQLIANGICEGCGCNKGKEVR